MHSRDLFKICPQEKIVASCSKRLIIVAGKTEFLRLNCKKIPIKVSPMAYVAIKHRIESLFGGELKLRMAKAKDGPCVTDNCNFLLDCSRAPQRLILTASTEKFK